ncbi:MAG: XdhC family aldehyde oxidoreductase maturation factor [Anaerolineaceae bacterium]
MNQIIEEEMQKLSDQGESFALATILMRNGSAPRSTGAKMLVRKDGTIAGTVGGGILEARVQELAARVIQDHRATIQNYKFSGKDASTMDAICGGQVDVLVEWIDATDPHLAALIHGMHVAREQHRKAWLVTVVSEETFATAHALVQPDGTVLGTLPSALTFETVRETRLPRGIETSGLQIMIEPINISGSAYIFGAGHVGRSLAEFTKAVGFWTVVLDDRAEYANDERFPTADEVVVLDSYDHLLDKFTFDRDSFVVIVTRGHMNDRAVLAQILKSDAGYVGMIGSRRKCGLVFDALRQEGFTEADIQRVYAPIGVAIDAETPEEIGISIVAEMIQARARLQKNG